MLTPVDTWLAWEGRAIRQQQRAERQQRSTTTSLLGRGTMALALQLFASGSDAIVVPDEWMLHTGDLLPNVPGSYVGHPFGSGAHHAWQRDVCPCMHARAACHSAGGAVRH